MAALIDVDPNNVQPFPAIRRVLIVRGGMPLDESSDVAAEATQRLLIALVGSVTIQATVNTKSVEFVLSAPTKGLLVASDTWLRLEARSDDSVLAVLEAGQEETPAR